MKCEWCGASFEIDQCYLWYGNICLQCLNKYTINTTLTTSTDTCNKPIDPTEDASTWRELREDELQELEKHA